MRLIEYLFGCQHRRTTFPLSPKHRHATSLTRVVCLDCGREFRYDWREMRVVEESEPKSVPAEAR